MWILSLLKANWKWVAAAIVIVFVYFKATSVYDDYKQAKEDQAQAVLRMALDLQAAQVSNQSKDEALRAVEEQQRKTEMLLLDALRRQDEIRKEAKDQVDVFEDHDFPALTEAKPGLIERLANKATAERMQEIEDALNY